MFFVFFLLPLDEDECEAIYVFYKFAKILYKYVKSKLSNKK